MIDPLSESSTPPPATRFVVYQFCVSLGIVSFKRSSAVKMLAPGQSAVAAGLPYSLISLVVGWWGIPWGPFWTIQTIVRNFRGGIDVTAAVAALRDRPPLDPALDDRPDWMKGAPVSR